MHNAIVFLKSSKPMTPITLTWQQTKIPVLYPHSTQTDFFTSDNNGNTIIYHDLIKSSFHLLSGYQETINPTRDVHGRFPYEASIQHQLNIATLPIVNYYFDILITAIEQFCTKQQIPFSRKRLFENFGFLLSHDVDRIALYSPKQTIHKSLQLLGLKPINDTIGLILKMIGKGVLHLICPWWISDPWWNFKAIIRLEKSLGIRSSYYFLTQRGKMDGCISFKTKRIQKLIDELHQNNCEIALHGSYYSIANKSVVTDQKTEMNHHANVVPQGIRQHFLRVDYPHTLRLHQEAGFRYDTSLGFASHAGYRNSYCYPFKPFDHEKNEMLDIWEVPLMLMEVSVLDYQKAGFEGISEATDQMIGEAQKFGGFFSLLWHNCRMSDYDYPGVNSYYQSLLEGIMQKEAESITGIDLINKIDHL